MYKGDIIFFVKIILCNSTEKRCGGVPFCVPQNLFLFLKTFDETKSDSTTKRRWDRFESKKASFEEKSHCNSRTFFPSKKRRLKLYEKIEGFVVKVLCVESKWLLSQTMAKIIQVYDVFMMTSVFGPC